MKKRLFILLLTVFVIFSMVPYARASEQIRATRSDTVFSVDGARTPIRAYTIAGNTYVSLFEIAISLSGSEKRFSPWWGENNQVINITSGRPFTAIGLNLSRMIEEVETAKQMSIKVYLDGSEVDISAYSIGDDVYFNLHRIARALDICVGSYPLENKINLNTSRLNADSYVTRRGIDPTKPMVALTFDDGPSRFTPPILDVLEQYNATATFYVTGNRIEGHREIVERAFNLGNEIASHAWSHRYLPRLSEGDIRTELQLTNDAIEHVTGIPPSNLRPPYGAFDDKVREIAAEFGLPIVMWTLDPADWRTRNAEMTFDYIMSNVSDRDVILLHDLSEPTAEAAALVIPALINRGFQLVTVTELIRYSGITAIPGEVYYSSVNVGLTEGYGD